MENLSIKLNDIAQMLGGNVTGNDADVIITSFATSPLKATENDLVFLYDQKYIKKINDIKAKAFILPIEEQVKLTHLRVPILWVERPRFVLKQLLSFIAKPKYVPKNEIHISAVIDSAAKIGKNCSIGAHVVIGPDCNLDDGVTIYPNTYIGKGVSIGQESWIGPSCTIFDNSRIGKKVILHAGVVLGTDGFSYITEEEGNLEKIRKGKTDLITGRLHQHKIPTMGNVILEDFVEVGANTTIDAGTIDSTIIGEGTKIDNLCMIAHNVKVGKDCLLVANIAVGGSTTFGDRVVVGGQVCFADHMTIGDDAAIVGGSALHGHVPPRVAYMGYLATPVEEYIKNQRSSRRSPRKIEKLEEQVKDLQEKLAVLEDKLKVLV